ncbi:hypothetical protein TRFO_11606 [Tritrichomonas foetus]|uniref:Uncharacterized protein n=1 Tax=Tritrichomonas foetus TaxID=1144522 RepID=A0A1J4J636_9EUKA|nr:hypothetical protein TRFO_11606 [Tritrichomonas foetus]|eukprot:OHS93623.1 hypothetical protein TRFO_11606 [Tritrichomonas foetus]
MILLFSLTTLCKALNITEILDGYWNITSYLIDEYGREHYQDRTHYALNLKHSQSNFDLYGFLYTFVDRIQNDDDVSIRLAKNEKYDKSYSLMVSLSEVSPFTEVTLINFTIHHDQIITATGQTLNGIQYSLVISAPFYAELTTYDLNTNRMDMYRMVKAEKKGAFTRWHILPFALTILYTVAKFVFQQQKHEEIHGPY